MFSPTPHKELFSESTIEGISVVIKEAPEASNVKLFIIEEYPFTEERVLKETPEERLFIKVRTEESAVICPVLVFMLFNTLSIRAMFSKEEFTFSENTAFFKETFPSHFVFLFFII